MEHSDKKLYRDSAYDRLTPKLLAIGLETERFGRVLKYFEVTDSTNLVAMKEAAAGAPEGTCVVAEEQTGGRGRLGRSWASPAYKNILLSVIFRPQVKPGEMFLLTAISSIAVVRAIEQVTSLDAMIKWPNDIYINNKKVCGILTESEASADGIHFVVVGIGLNVNFNPEQYPEIYDIATSLKQETGTKVSRIALIQEILMEMEHGSYKLGEGKTTDIIGEWSRYSLILGKSVEIISFDNKEYGIAEKIEDDGTLILKKDDGTRKKIVFGDVSLRMHLE